MLRPHDRLCLASAPRPPTEHFHAMITHTIPNFLFIWFSILFLRLIAPLSFIYLVTASIFAELRNPYIAAYAAIESLFYAILYLPRKYRVQRRQVSAQERSR